MQKPGTYRWPLAFALLASLLVIARAQPAAQTPAQESGQNPAPAPAASSAQPPAATGTASPVPAQALVVPQRQATPEELGDSLTGHQRYQAAIAAYASDPHPSSVLWNKMGIAYQMMFNLKDAARCYRESLKLDPRNATVWNNLATTYDAGKDYRNGEKNYRKAIKIDPQSAVFFKNLGTNLLAQHKYDKGGQAYQQALALDPSIFQDHSSPKVQNPSSVGDRGAMNYYMARGCVRSGQFDCAIQFLRLALNEGYTDAGKVSKDQEFTALRGLPAFKQLLDEQKQQKPQNP